MTDLTKFKPFFSKVIGEYHKNDPKCALKHENNWDISGVGEGGVLDLQKNARLTALPRQMTALNPHLKLEVARTKIATPPQAILRQGIYGMIKYFEEHPEEEAADPAAAANTPSAADGGPSRLGSCGYARKRACCEISLPR